ncbi:MAG TPA: hypothetical protein VJ044_16975 [Candidatus Hodarchaeales archaeon]|nr:hypothetical protein [Candidatus Hodarchaeales archaeon]
MNQKAQTSRPGEVHKCGRHSKLVDLIIAPNSPVLGVILDEIRNCLDAALLSQYDDSEIVITWNESSGEKQDHLLNSDDGFDGYISLYFSICARSAREL